MGEACNVLLESSRYANVIGRDGGPCRLVSEASTSATTPAASADDLKKIAADEAEWARRQQEIDRQRNEARMARKQARSVRIVNERSTAAAASYRRGLEAGPV